MKLAWILWLASLLPPSYGDQLCLATTLYLEARNQPEAGQRAVAEVALRRLDSGYWGDNLCAVVTAPGQFAPSMVSPRLRIKNLTAWEKAVKVANEVSQEWKQPLAKRHQVVPGADHFVALAQASPAWAAGVPVATIGDHTFYHLLRL